VRCKLCPTGDGQSVALISVVIFNRDDDENKMLDGSSMAIHQYKQARNMNSEYGRGRTN